MIGVRDLANSFILDLVPYEPGKPVEDVARELGLEPGQIIKLASNENPIGPSPAAVRAVREALAKAHFYPDGGAYHLRNAIAERYGLERANVILGNGSNEIILLLFQAFVRAGVHEIVVPRNSFAVYELAAQLFGVNCIKVDDGPNFAPDLDALLAAITPQTRLVFVASPNNPTGVRIDNDDLARFLERLPEHVICGLDEAYYEFLDNPPDSLRFVREGAKVCIMRTFSKIQGLAGLRVGYGIASTELVDLLQRSRQPFNVNALAQAAALASFQDEEHQRKTKELTDAGRTQLVKAFEEAGLEQIPSAANFVLVKVGDGDAVFKRLLKRGVIVRSMKSYRLPEWIRVSIGTEKQNARFLKELPFAIRDEEPPFPVPAAPEPDAELVTEEPVSREFAAAVDLVVSNPNAPIPTKSEPELAEKPQSEEPEAASEVEKTPEPVLEPEPVEEQAVVEPVKEPELKEESKVDDEPETKAPEPEKDADPEQEPATPSPLFEPTEEIGLRNDISTPPPADEALVDETSPGDDEPEAKDAPVADSPESAEAEEPEPEATERPVASPARVEIEDRHSGQFRDADAPKGIFGTIRRALRSMFGR